LKGFNHPGQLKIGERDWSARLIYILNESGRIRDNLSSRENSKGKDTDYKGHIETDGVK
jgi:hypothetical protein